jgi:hypothetical protein
MPVNAKHSLRYDLVCDGAVRRYPNGREVCCSTPKGRAEYERRTEEMRLRQHNICARGNHFIVNPTFDHGRSRGGGGGFRDDRIVNEETGETMSGCSCWYCNGQAGSKPLTRGTESRV